MTFPEDTKDTFVYPVIVFLYFEYGHITVRKKSSRNFVLLTLLFCYTFIGRMYRLWILQIIRDGMKSDLDFQVSQRCVVFKLLLSFYSSVLADDDTKVG
jgi:hypothetical protein